MTFFARNAVYNEHFISMFDLSTGTIVNTIKQKTYKFVQYPNSNILAILNYDGKIIFFNTEINKIIYTLEIPNTRIHSILFTKSGEYMILELYNKNLYTYELSIYEINNLNPEILYIVIKNYVPISEKIYKSTVLEDNTVLIKGEYNIILYNIDTNEKSNYLTYDDENRCIRFELSPDFNKLAYDYWDCNTEDIKLNIID